jgi:DNA-binding protein Fis
MEQAGEDRGGLKTTQDQTGSAAEPEWPRRFVQEYLKSHPGVPVHRDLMELMDKLLVVESLRMTQGNQTQAAKLLGLTRPTLQAKMQRHGLRRETSVQDT